jgi:hypothetical protein
MGERYQAGVVNGGDQDTRRDSDGFLYVIVFELPAIRKNTRPFREDHDQIRCLLEKGFVLIGGEGSKSVRPFFYCLAMTKPVLFLLCSDSNLLLTIGSVKTTKRQGCTLAPFGAVTAASRQASITSVGIGLFENSVQCAGVAAAAPQMRQPNMEKVTTISDREIN